MGRFFQILQAPGERHCGCSLGSCQPWPQLLQWLGAKQKCTRSVRKDIFETNIFKAVRNKVIRKVSCNDRIRMCFHVIVWNSLSFLNNLC